MIQARIFINLIRYVIVYAASFCEGPKERFRQVFDIELVQYVCTIIKEVKQVGASHHLNCDCFLLNPGLSIVFCHKLGFNRNSILSCKMKG